MRGLSAMFVAIGTLGWVSAAEAIVSKKRWDPAYGVDLPNLGWSGTVDFEIQDSCLNTITSSGWITNLTTGCVGKLSISSATVTLYDILDPSGKPGPNPDIMLSYDGASAPFGGDNAQLTIRMYVDVLGTEKNLVAVEGGFLLPEVVHKTSETSFAVAAGYDAAAYWLNFNSNLENDFLSTGIPEDGYAFLTSCSYKYSKWSSGVNCSQNDGQSYPAVLSPVPEPETYLLGLASFSVLGVWARRRRLRAH
jgi:hypothetical protein